MATALVSSVSRARLFFQPGRQQHGPLRRKGLRIEVGWADHSRCRSWNERIIILWTLTISLLDLAAVFLLPPLHSAPSRIGLLISIHPVSPASSCSLSFSFFVPEACRIETTDDSLPWLATRLRVAAAAISSRTRRKLACGSGWTRREHCSDRHRSYETRSPSLRVYRRHGRLWPR